MLQKHDRYCSQSSEWYALKTIPMTIIACHTIPSWWGWKLVSTVAYSVLLWMIVYPTLLVGTAAATCIHPHFSLTLQTLLASQSMCQCCFSQEEPSKINKQTNKTNKQTKQTKKKQQLSSWNFQLEKSIVVDSLLSFWQQKRSGRAFVFASSMPPPWLGTVLAPNYPSDPGDLEIAAK